MCRTQTRHVHLARHARPCAGHPRLFLLMSQAWVAGTSPAMTAEIDACRSYSDHLQPQRGALAMMRVRDGDRERVGGVGGFWFGLRQQNLQHHQNLVLVGVASADHGLLHLVRGVFRNRYPEHRRRQHCNTPRLAELQRGDAVPVNEGLFDCGFSGAEIAEHSGEALMDRQEAARQRQAFGRFHRTATDEHQPVAVDLDHAPAGAAQARIDAKNADGMANRLRCHGVLVTPEAGRRNIYWSSYPAKPGYPVRRTVDDELCRRVELVPTAPTP